MSKPVLLVEGNPDDERLALYAMKKNGLGEEEIAVTRDGSEALEYLFGVRAGRGADGLPGLVLLDHRLPGVDGPEVLRRLRTDDRTASLPVVVLTAGDLPEMSDDYGAWAFIRKPLTPEKLAEAARKLGVRGLLPGEAAPREKQAVISEPSRAASRGSKPLRVLLVEGSEDDAALILRALRRGGHEPVHRRVETRAGMETALAEEEWDILVSDYHLPAFSAMEALEITRESGLDLPFIVVSGKIGEDVAVEVMRAGAHDYVMKANLAWLGPAVEREVREARGRWERRRAEAMLRESEHRFRSLVQNSSDITVVLDARGIILYESPAVERMLGYTPEERVGRNIFDLVHPGDVERVSGALARSLEEPGVHPSIEYRVRHKDGPWRHFEAVGNNLLSDPIVKGIVINSRDVTDRKRTEEQLEESEDLHRAVVEQAAENIFLVDLDTRRILEANAALHRSLGYTDGELQQLTLYDIVVYDRESIDLNIRRLMEERPFFVGERSYRRKDGSLMDVEVSASAISYGGKEAMCIVAHDVTERKRAEEELRRQRDLYEGVLTAQSEVGEGFLIAEGSRINFANEAFCEISGYGREELLAMPSFFELFPAEERPVFRERFVRRVNGEGGQDHQEIAILRKDGRRVELEIAAKMLQEEDRVRFVIVARDITDRKRAEEELRHSESSLAAAQRIAHIGNWEYSIREDKAYWSDELYRVFGADPQGFAPTYESFLECAHPDDRILLRRAVRKALLGGELTGSIEYRIVRPDGEVRFAESQYELSRDASGRPYELTGTVQDITERKRAEEELERRARLLDLGSDAILVRDLQDRITFWNRGAEEMYGWKSEEALGRVSHELFDTRFPEPLEQVRSELLRGGEWEGDLTHTRRDSKTIMINSRWALQRDERGEPTGILENNTDITERKQAEEDLHHSLGMLLTLYEGSNILSSTLKPEEVGGRLLEILHRVSGLTAAAISLRERDGRFAIRQSIGLESLWPKIRYTPEVRENIEAALKSGKTQIFRLRPPDGRKAQGGEPTVGLCLPLRARTHVGGVLEVYGPESLAQKDTLAVLEGLTNQAASALENAGLYGELAEREHRLEDLVGKLMTAQEEERRRVAYEVHDGLAQVATAAHQHLQAFARFHLPDSEDGRKILHRALELVQRTVGDARRIIANLRPTTLDDFGLQAAVRLEIEALRAEDWHISFEGTLREDERLSFAVETALFRIVQEALTNIRKHANTKHVHLSLDRLEQSIRLSVRDWGQGFDPAALQNSGGPGERIGLSSMRERVALLGGDFQIRSHPGAGTLITVDAPLSKQREADREREDSG